MLALGLALAALIGLSLGLLGGGGSILTVPILVYVLGFDAKAAIALSLPVVGVTSLVGVMGHWRAGNVNLRIALLFGTIAMLAAFLGARLSRELTGTVQLIILGVVMLGAAFAMLRGRPEGDPDAERRPLPLILGSGFAVGMLTGLVGVGGGFLAVPALVLLARAPMKQAVGTSLLVIVMNSAAGFAGYIGQVEIPWGFMTAFTGAAVLGILVGTRLVHRVPQAQLRRAFAVFLVAMAALILYQNRSVLTHRGTPDGGASVR